MNSKLFCAVAVVAALLLGPGIAAAASYSLTCNNNNTDKLQAALMGTTAWTTGGTHAIAAGDTVTLNNNYCQGDIHVGGTGAAPGFTMTGGEGTDGINGQLEIEHGSVTISYIFLVSGQNGDVMTNGEFANLYVHDGGSANVIDSAIEDGPLMGVYVTRGSAVEMFGPTVQDNGTANTANENDGIRADAASSVYITITPNGYPAYVNGNTGNGITVIGASSLTINGVPTEQFAQNEVGNNGLCSTQCSPQIYLDGASTAHLSTTIVYVDLSDTTPPPLVEVFGGSSLIVDDNSLIENYVGNYAAAALLVSGSSTARLNATTLSTTGVSAAVIEASGGSSLVLAGGNTITATGAAGTAIQIDHSSNLTQQKPTAFGYTAAAETVSGAGLVQEQSSMDLGQGLVSSSPSMSWNPGSNGIQVQQNSAFRVAGGVSITGGVTITQGSNAFSNTANGGTNAITSGSCPFTTIPASHWASPAKVTPAVPSATSLAAAVSPQCLPF